MPRPLIHKKNISGGGGQIYQTLIFWQAGKNPVSYYLEKEVDLDVYDGDHHHGCQELHNSSVHCKPEQDILNVVEHHVFATYCHIFLTVLNDLSDES